MLGVKNIKETAIKKEEEVFVPQGRSSRKHSSSSTPSSVQIEFTEKTRQQQKKSLAEAEADANPDDDSSCSECRGRGLLICCDFCAKAFHQECIHPLYYPSPGHHEKWECPDCQILPFKRLAEKRNLPNPIKPDKKHCNQKSSLRDSSTKSSHSVSSVSTTSTPQTNSFISPKVVVVDKVKQKKTSRIMDKKSRIPAIMASDKHTPAVGADILSSKLSLGPKHQSPIPLHFLETIEYGNRYDGEVPHLKKNSDFYSRQKNKCSLIYSPTFWAMCLEAQNKHNIENKENIDDAGPPSDSATKETSDSSPSENQVIANKDELTDFLYKFEERWSVPSNPYPYSLEWALKILNFTGFRKDVALCLLEDKSFNWSEVCDLPSRPYPNKWSPSDKRGQILATPFPPPSNLKIKDTTWKLQTSN